ncbi:ankyrin repeat-containing domain protein [Dactylonectria estremocensis]|uniref:protein S-acyltransferase n=1 Tax=Dactylonectria estremocensis TaxID=1079267 RepID=A0A9P9F5I9_9HYPO|nr:ankyrin repeat-containing domain protein [Dactylonectria estremocensis]
MSSDIDVVMEDANMEQHLSLANTPSLTGIPPEVLLNVYMHLEEDELLNATRVCSMISGCAIQILFKRDIESGFKALSWATLHASEDVGAKIIRKYLDFGGNINKFCILPNVGFCTALHLASAKNKVLIVQLLLEMGANPSSLARHLCSVMELFGDPSTYSHDRLHKSFSDHATSNGVMHSDWLPLLIPLLEGHTQIVDLLMGHGASGYLAIQPRSCPLQGPRRQFDSAGNRRIYTDDPVSGYVLPHNPDEDLEAVTPFHLIIRQPDPLINIHRLKMKFPNLIIHRCPGRGFKPIHVAAYTGDEAQIRQLLRERSGAVRLLDSWGLTPLFLAIERAMVARDEGTRQRFLRTIQTLMEMGPSINRDQSATPLLVGAASKMRHSWDFNRPYIKKIINLVIKKGANLHGQDARGETLAKALARSVKAVPGNASLAKFALHIIDTIGPGPVVPQKSRYDILAHHGQDLTGHIIRSGFHQCLIRQNAPHFNALRERFGIPGGAERLLWEYLDQTSHGVGKLGSNLVREPAFNPDFVGMRGRGFLHLIVIKLGAGNGPIPQDVLIPRATIATKDAKLFLKAGTSAHLRDNDGFTAFDLLLQYWNHDILALHGILERATAHAQG